MIFYLKRGIWSKRAEWPSYNAVSNPFISSHSFQPELHNYRNRTPCMPRNRNPYSTLLMVKTASGMSHGRVRPTTTNDEVAQHGGHPANTKSCCLGLQHKLVVPFPRTNYMKNSFSYSCATLWNSLPYNIRESSSLNQFKRLRYQYFKYTAFMEIRSVGSFVAN